MLSCTIWMYYTYLLLDGLFHIPFNQTTILVCTLNMSATEFNNQHADMCSCKHRCVKLKPNFFASHIYWLAKFVIEINKSWFTMVGVMSV